MHTILVCRLMLQDRHTQVAFAESVYAAEPGPKVDRLLESWVHIWRTSKSSTTYLYLALCTTTYFPMVTERLRDFTEDRVGSARRRIVGEIAGRGGGRAETAAPDVPGLKWLEVPGLTRTSLLLNLTHVEDTT